ncbi:MULTISPECIES: TetR/AcrR family transcriptional regulator [unclassified Streptomyces]|uniref:TetR/AcrR family transcriptional regulator n=1 Tax=unclassified Streptomyces TaxID=2593676 RepID=UPI002DD86A99|nr:MULTISPECIES: TetR/AcrR family transcriptional regulator [unclassified Streptomyces]WSA94696.1 TetR/AcrR family transcriptional regulator [Streptomyces sp. NBC_01795]WSB79115.1 TetR/AcrR family transcriptional regulator [Streptomyces sp. NBC_01775]WSS12683.1 TetR/AcrR family transcriptional regulator [Streptomyces sp. NBC_01186]WSS41467.1 TetR/AcrR family transcriptional regulator [Streptomyces sp. NBC_01187]
MADTSAGGAPRRKRVDAQRNVDALIAAAVTVFDTSGVDAPAREIADLAGVGVGTLYRHFPLRSDLVKAVVESGIDAVSALGPQLSATQKPADALAAWLRRYTEFLGAKRGLAPALHSGDPAYKELPGYFLEKVGPTLAVLLENAAAAGVARDDVTAHDVLYAIANLCMPVPVEQPAYRHQRMVAVLIDGLLTPHGSVAAPPED